MINLLVELGCQQWFCIVLYYLCVARHNCVGLLLGHNEEVNFKFTAITIYCRYLFFQAFSQFWWWFTETKQYLSCGTSLPPHSREHRHCTLIQETEALVAWDRDVCLIIQHALSRAINPQISLDPTNIPYAKTGGTKGYKTHQARRGTTTITAAIYWCFFCII